MPHVVSNTGQPVGSIQHYGGGTVPASWLACDGSVLSQTTYAALFANIGAGYNTGGEGAGNFRIPDYRGRSPLGAGNGPGLSARSVGQSLGEETHTLSVAELASHSHADAGHSHSISVITGGPSVAGGSTFGNQPSNTGTGYANIQNNGGDGAHNNMQPSLVCNILIKVY